MDRLLARLERSLGRFAIERITAYIVGGMAIVFLLSQARPEVIDALTLDPARAPREPWRFVTYLFIPRGSSLIWTLFALYWTWLVGMSLEQEWGAFKLNVYYVVGALGTTAAAWITHQPQANFWLNTSLFFAFATIFPDYVIYLFYIVPIKVKWLALLALAGVAFSFFTGGWGARAAIGVALGNYLLFFGGHLVSLARGQQLQVRQAARRSQFKDDRSASGGWGRASVRPGASGGSSGKGSAGAKAAERVCAICGKRQDDGADIRVCSCEKCGGPRELCLEHARNH